MQQTNQALLGYQAPLDDMMFLMNHVVGLDEIARLPGYEEATPETVTAVLGEAARFFSEVLAPLNRVGDRQPARWRDGRVETPPGFVDAWQQYRDAGWQGLQHPSTYGGQGLPHLLAAACTEMLNAANLSFALCPLLSDGAIEALMTAGSDVQRATYLPKLISGEWTGTMNLTEPQAGSDLAQVRTRALPSPDGSYRLFGTKIFITYGDHDMASNIVHLVLARLPDAPPGVKGLSLFVVPKYRFDAHGVLGERNAVHCLSLEHKLGIHGSPTAVLQFGGEQGTANDSTRQATGAWGEMLGEPHCGLQTMFIMMNAARFGVGLQGIGIADRAYQAARRYALERVQGKPIGVGGKGRTGASIRDGIAGNAEDAANANARNAANANVNARNAANAESASVPSSSSGPAPIAGHPDVRRMLGTMRALVEGARALAFELAAASDIAQHAETADRRRHHAALQDYLVPIVKGWSTEMAVDVSSLAVQVHGGMGFIEETGVAQYYRDARILPIYEGTTAIQANDLVGRKTLKDRGAMARGLVASIGETVEALRAAAAASGSTAQFTASSAAAGSEKGTAASLSAPASSNRTAMPASLSASANEHAAIAAAFGSIATQLQSAQEAFADVIDSIVERAESDPRAVYAGSVLYLKMAGVVLSGWMLARSALAAQAAVSAQQVERTFAMRKRASAQCFAEQVLPLALSWRVAILTARSDQSVLSLTDEQC